MPQYPKEVHPTKVGGNLLPAYRENDRKIAIHESTLGEPKIGGVTCEQNIPGHLPSCQTFQGSGALRSASMAWAGAHRNDRVFFWLIIDGPVPIGCRKRSPKESDRQANPSYGPEKTRTRGQKGVTGHTPRSGWRLPAP